MNGNKSSMNSNSMDVGIGSKLQDFGFVDIINLLTSSTVYVLKLSNLDDESGSRVIGSEHPVDFRMSATFLMNKSSRSRADGLSRAVLDTWSMPVRRLSITSWTGRHCWKCTRASSYSLSRGRYGAAPVHVEPTRDDPRQSWFFDTVSRASLSGVEASDIRHQTRPLADVASPW